MTRMGDKRRLSRIGAMGLMLAAIACGGPPARAPIDAQIDAACSGLQCDVVDCTQQGKPPTTISGVVYAPNGKLPLHGAQVYVPFSDPPPFAEGVQCEPCVSGAAGGAIAETRSAVDGRFTLTNVPAGDAVPLIVTMGKWRRKVVVPNIVACT